MVLVQPEIDQSLDMWIMGDPFLRAYYSIYDMDSKRVGLVGVGSTTFDKYELPSTSKNGTNSTLSDWHRVALDSIKGALKSAGLEFDDNQVYIYGGTALFLCIFITACCASACKHCCCSGSDKVADEAQINDQDKTIRV